MASLASGARVQVRVIQALLIRELATRFGRNNIGFLWIMAEPLLFAVLVGIIWTYMKGPTEHGISVFAFVITGYIPLVLFRHAVNRSIMLFSVNGALMYHRQIKIHDFIIARFMIEFIGHTMAFIVIAGPLMALGSFPWPDNWGLVLLGWMHYSFFTLCICFVLAPLSEMSEILEKIVPVATYIMIPFSGAFNLVSWITPSARSVLMYSPPVHAMEMIRSGVFGHAVNPYYNQLFPFAVSIVLAAIGLFLCRKVRRTLVVE